MFRYLISLIRISPYICLKIRSVTAVRLSQPFFTAKAAFKRLIGECGARSPQLSFGVLRYLVSTIAANTTTATANKSNRFCFMVFCSNCLSVINLQVNFNFQIISNYHYDFCGKVVNVVHNSFSLVNKSVNCVPIGPVLLK